ncbi:MAG: reverse transcriptase domain-containing protein [Pseudomonadota bacterium]
MLSFDDLTAWENLLLAYQKASKGKRGRFDVALFEYNLEAEILQLQGELRERSYRPGPYTSFTIHEPKRRLISAAPFRDRVVHHVLCNIIEPGFESSFVADSFANRLGKGTHRALDQAQRYSRSYRYVLQLDVRQFFPSIDHAILFQALSRKVTDPDMLWLIRLILASGHAVFDEEYRMVYFPGDDLFAVNRPRGLPIGNLTSQFWANVYLNGLDYFVKRELRCPGYVRYVDDLLLFGNDKADLWHWKERLEQRFASLRLTIHPGAHPRPVSEGIPFLGFIVFSEKRRLKRRKGINFQRRLHGMLKDFNGDKASAHQIASNVDGWLNHVRYANTAGLMKTLLKQVPLEVRQLLHSELKKGL